MNVDGLRPGVAKAGFQIFLAHLGEEAFVIPPEAGL